MPKLGLSSKLSSSALVTPGVVTDSLVMKHMYPAETVQPLSDGAVKLVRTDDNNGDYIDTGTSLSTGTVISVACWIRPSGATNEYMGIIGPKVTDEHSSNVWLLRRDNGNKYQFIVDWSNKVEIASTLVEDGEWHHLCGTYDGSTIKFYLDGVLQGTQAESSHDVSCENIYLGTYWMDTNVRKYYFDGHMCNAAVWTGALTSAQIKSIMWKQYADLTTTEKTSLVSWWNLDNTITTDGTVNFVLDEADTTLTTAPEQTWVVQAGSPSVSGQEITMTAGEVQQVGCTLSTGIGYYKVNMTVEDYSGSGSLSLLWDGGASSDLTTTANGTFEWITYLDASPTIHSQSGAAGKITVNSIKKYNGNAGQLI